MKTVKIRGDIIPNDYKWIYDWLEYDSTCPKDIEGALSQLEEGEDLIVDVNSPGGVVSAGIEIYGMLHGKEHVTFEVTGIAASAAGVITQAGYVRMHPTSMLMIHNVSGSAEGDYHEMDRTSNALQTMNEALASAYAAKSGRALEEIVKDMDRETWITAQKAVELGFADEVIGTGKTETNGIGQLSVTPQMMQQAIKEKEAYDREKEKLELSISLYGE